jgi:peptidoglycan/LPS O-acetylase OafA/YrhL
MTYLPFVDGLRAVAILAVVAFHAWPRAVPGGFAGVDVFFVISGFLITRFIAAEMADGRFSLARFFVRRARRLLPAALVCFVSISALSAFVLLPDAYWYFGRSLLSAVLMYANIFFYRTGGYFSAPSLEKPLLHTWSLAVEDQFYLTWPLLLLILLPRVSRKALCGIAVAMLLVSLAFAEFKIGRDPEFAFFQLPTRAWELLIGALLALSASRLALSQPIANALAVSGFAAILGSFALLSPDAHFPGLGALPACLGTAAIVASGLNQTNLTTRTLALPPVVFTGLISYSLYLWHWPLIALASYRIERPLVPVEAAAVIAVSALMAFLSWRFVERPFRSRHIGGTSNEPARQALPQVDRRFVAGALSGVVLAACVALVLKIERGFPQRYHAGVRAVLEQMVSGNPVRSSCDNYQNIFRNDAVCNFGRKKTAGESYEVAVFGDSMADHWTPLVAKFAQLKNLAGRQVTNGGCGLFFGVDIPATPGAKARECAAYQREAEKFIAENPKLKVAVISGYWEKWLGRIEAQKILTEAELPVSKTAIGGAIAAPRFDAVLAKTVKVFTDRGIKVLLIGQIPGYPELPVRCVVASIEEGSDAAKCGKPKTAAIAELATSNQALTRAAGNSPLVSTDLPLDYMCQTDRCSPILKGTYLYHDGGHLNRYGSEILGEFLRFPELN